MARILILGDSWGVSKRIWPGEENWTEYYFLKRSHTVFNKSWGGVGNEVQLNFGLSFLKYSGVEIDLVIWYHTELFRQQDGFMNPEYMREHGLLTFEDSVDAAAGFTYNLATELKQAQPQAQWAIIGGHAPIRQQRRELLAWADLIIDDWRSEIVGYKLPECHILELRDFLVKYNLDPELVAEQLNYRDQIIEACKNYDLFPDWVHPGIRPVTELNLRLQNQFNL